ncbi:MAG: YfcE family phosphodiesterase [Candidatus Bathyarchaeia archaeon]|jgi:putative phosphoesterase
MSVAVKNQPLNGNESYCLFGCDMLSKLLKSFEAQIDGVIDNQDIECVHKMRVSTRKIRAVMPIFQSCYPKKKYKRWLTEIKAVTKLLGEARDLDVQITFLQNYIQKSPQHQDLTPLLKDHKDRRKTVQATVVDGLEKLRDSKVLPEFSDFLKQAVGELSSASSDSLSVKEKACWNITSMLNDFLTLSEYVHQESAVLRHHEMRIKAKRLRYTMETFSSLYPNVLSQEMQVMKDFQDLLGEMHDCDVWISYLSSLTLDESQKEYQKRQIKKEMKTLRFKKAVADFSVYVTDNKKSHYTSFVKLWDECVAQDFFGKLQDTLNAEAGLGTKRIDSALFSSPNLKVAVLSDIHANVHALEWVIRDAERRGVQVFLNAGDSVGFGACPNEVIQLLYKRNMVSVCGNFDSEIFKEASKGNGAKKVALEYAKKELTKLCKVYLHSFPEELKLELAGKKVFMTHASPLSPTEHLTHKTPDARLKTVSAGTNADLIIVGHSHDQFHRQVGSVSILNPGSVGRPSDGNPQAAYAMLSFNPFKVDLIRLTYPVEDAAEALRKKGLPESFAQMLLCGKPLETIITADKTKKGNTNRNWTEVFQKSRDLAKSYMQETHVEQVRELALNLFDNLKSLHRLGVYERNLLECAALLHDLGLSKTVKAHNKASMEIILNDTKLPLTSEERRVVASIARYHRGGLPKQKHYNLTTLNSKTVNEISILSAFLRVADALDYLHNSDVNLLSVKNSSKRVTLECSSKSDTSLVERAFDKKKDLFEKVFKKKVVLTWTKQ